MPLVRRPDDIADHQPASRPGLRVLLPEILPHRALAVAVRPQLVNRGVRDSRVNRVRLEDLLQNVALVEVHERSAEMAGPLSLFRPSHELARDLDADQVRIREVTGHQGEQRPVRAALIHDLPRQQTLPDIGVLDVDDLLVAHPQGINSVVAVVGQAAGLIEQRIAPQAQHPPRDIREVLPEVKSRRGQLAAQSGIMLPAFTHRDEML